MLFWSLDSPNTSENKTFKRWPWFTLLVLSLSLLLFVIFPSNYLNTSEKRIHSAQRQLLCYYLEHPHLLFPQQKRYLLPPHVRSYSSQLTKIIENYRRNPRTRRRIEKLLHGDGWSTPFYLKKRHFRDQKECLEYAASQQLLEDISKTRIQVRLAQSNPSQLTTEKKRLATLIAQLEKIRFTHLHYKWGLIPAQRQFLPLLTSFFLQNSSFFLVWQLLLFWLIGGVLERRWGTPRWALISLGTTLIGGLLTWWILPEHGLPILGMGLALSGLMGLWLALYDLSDIYIAIGLPFTRFQFIFPTPAVILWASWFLLELYSHIILMKYSLLSLAPIAANFTLFLLATLTLRLTGLLKNALDYEEDLLFDKPTLRPLRIPSRNSEHLHKKLEEAQKAVQKGANKEAVALYRSLLQKGKHPYTHHQAFFNACRNARIIPEANEFIKAIRAAAQEQNFTKVKELYQNFLEHHEKKPLSDRSRFDLASDLKRASLYSDALIQSYKIVKKGVDQPFFIQAFLLWADAFLTKLDEDGQAHNANKLFHIQHEFQHAKEALHLYPEYREKLQTLEERLDKLLAQHDGNVQPDEIGDFIIEEKQTSSDKNELFEALSNIGKEKQESWDDLPDLQTKKIEGEDVAEILGIDFESWSSEWELEVDQNVIQGEAIDELPSDKSTSEVPKIVASPDLLEDLMAEPWQMEAGLQEAVEQENVLMLTDELLPEEDPYLGQLEPIVGQLLDDIAPQQPTPSDSIEPHFEDVEGWSDEWDAFVADSLFGGGSNFTPSQIDPLTLQKTALEETDRIVAQPDMLEDLLAQPWEMENRLQNAVEQQQAIILEKGELDGELDLVLGVLIEDSSMYDNPIEGYHTNTTADYATISSYLSTNHNLQNNADIPTSSLPTELPLQNHSHHLDLSQTNQRQELTTMELSSPLTPTDLRNLLPQEESDIVDELATTADLQPSHSTIRDFKTSSSTEDHLAFSETLSDTPPLSTEEKTHKKS